MPTSVNCCFGSRVSTPTRSPSLRPASSAVFALTAISSAAVGPRPERSSIRLSVPVQFSPSRGAPCEVRTLPSLPITRAPSASMRPVAARTPEIVLIFSTAEAGSGVATSSPSISDTSIFGLALTETSVALKASAKIESKVRLSVSVTTNDPDTNITPSTTASPERTSRSLRASRLFSVARSIRASPGRRACPGASWCPGRFPRSGCAARRRCCRRRGRPPGRRSSRRPGRG